MYCPICGKEESCRKTAMFRYLIEEMKLVPWTCISCGINFLVDKSNEDVYEKGEAR
jgi:transposase-like protein